MQGEARDWYYEVTDRTPQEKMRLILKKASLVLKWPDPGWKARLAHKIGVNATVFAIWMNGGRSLRGEPLHVVVEYINKELQKELPHIAENYPHRYGKRIIRVTDLQDNVNDVLSFIKKTRGAVVVNDAEINLTIGILDSNDAFRLRGFGSKTSAKRVYKATLKELDDKDRLFPPRECKGRDFSVKSWDDPIEDVVYDLAHGKQFVIVRKSGGIECICRKPPAVVESYVISKERIEEYVANDLLFHVAARLVDLIPDEKFRKNGLYMDVGTGTGSGAKAILARVEQLFGGNCGTIIAAEDSNQVSFHDILSKEIKDKCLKHIELSFKKDGRRDLREHLKNRVFDIVVWNCISPRKDSLSSLDSILAHDGAIAISHYDHESLENVLRPVLEVLSQRGLYLEMPKDEMFNIFELRDLVLMHKDLNRKFKWILHQEEHEAHFISPRNFINYLHCASPFSAGCFALIEDSEAREEILSSLESEIRDKYGSNSLRIPFKMNYVIGLSEEEATPKRADMTPAPRLTLPLKRKSEGSPSVPIFLGDCNTPPQYGLLGWRKDNDQEIFLDLNTSKTISIFGAKGEGKSYTVGVIAEMSLLNIPKLNSLTIPFSVIVFHYSNDESYKPEYISLKQANNEKSDLEALAGKLGVSPQGIKEAIIIVPPNKIDKRKEEYTGLEVHPLRFNPAELDMEDWLNLMAAPRASSQSLYIEELERLLKKLKAEGNINVTALNEEIKKSSLNGPQKKLATTRLGIAEQYMLENSTLEQLIKPGRLTLLDLRDEMLESDKAMILCLIALKLFSKVNINKLIILDEAHKYMRSAFADEIVTLVAEMRHRPTSIIIASQNPLSIPDGIIGLSSITICHRITDKKWIKHIKNGCEHFSALDEAEFSGLQMGEAFIWASKATSKDFTTRPQKIRIRPRVTKHGGRTITAL
jgi:hypothetical protein